MNLIHNPRSRKNAIQQVYEALISEDGTMRAQAAYLFRQLGPPGQQFLVGQAIRSIRSAKKCIAALEALRIVGLPLGVDPALDAFMLLSHPNPAVREKAEEVFLALQSSDPEGLDSPAA